MRFVSALKNDMRYQLKYGFYFLYAFFSAVYIGILILIPAGYKGAAASVIILTDPAMLGTFFIGGIWLLEKREGLHGFWGVSPLRPVEYIMSKAASLSVISTLSAVVIVAAGYREARSYMTLLVIVFAGSMLFTLIGLVLATYARSVNQYILVVTLPSAALVMPAMLAVFGISHPLLDVMPGTALWRVIAYALGTGGAPDLWLWFVLPAWFGIALYVAVRRVPAAMLTEGVDRA